MVSKSPIKQKRRTDLLKYINSKPGVKATEIMVRFDWNASTARDLLREFVAEKKVATKKDGREYMYYSATAAKQMDINKITGYIWRVTPNPPMTRETYY